MRTDKEILKQTNKLANKIYERLGYVARKNFKFYKATQPREVMCWNIACDAQLILTETDVEGNIEINEGDDK